MTDDTISNTPPRAEQMKISIYFGSKLYLVGMLQDNLFKYGMIWG
jgi:hypothetical protein